MALDPLKASIECINRSIVFFGHGSNVIIAQANTLARLPELK